MITLSLSLFLLLFFNESRIFLFLLLMYYLLNGFNSGGFVVSFYLSILTFIVTFMVLDSSGKFYFDWFMVSVFFCIFIFFNSFNFVVFYTSFELTILITTILLIMMGGGVSSISSGFYMFFYTVGFSLLFLVGIFFLEKSTGTLSIFLYCLVCKKSVFISFLFSLVMLVKMPMLILHFWLPKAHVDSPVKGSMMLAGLILKMGSYGIIILSKIIFSSSLVKMLVIKWGILTCILGVLFCFYESDLSKVIAFSSVVHMAVMTLVLPMCVDMSFFSGLVIMFSHGVSSPMMFWSLNNLYYKSSTRNINSFSSSFMMSKMYSFMMSLVLLVNVGIPPFMSFVGEFLVCSLLVNVSWVMVILFMSMFLLMGLFNVMVNSKFVMGYSLSLSGSKYIDFSLLMDFFLMYFIYLVWSFMIWLFC